MYYITIHETDQNQLAYYCRNCGNKDTEIPTEGICVLKTAVHTKQGINTQTLINKYTKKDPTLPRVYNLPCPNEHCKTNTDQKTPKEVLYMRYDDDNLKYLYMCCVCDQVWK